jgi:hypothetical protein
VGNPAVLIWLTIAVALAIAFYWLLFKGKANAKGETRPSAVTLVLVFTALALAIWADYSTRPAYVYQVDDNPLVIAIAFDLSPSMLAIPDPATYPESISRFERGLFVLKELFRNLDENQENILVSIIGFTNRAEVIMGWEGNISQIREITEHVLSPGLFTSSGTNIENAVKALVGTYNRLPLSVQQNSNKVAILVSDGEDTTPYSYIDYVVKQLETASFDLIALQTGMLETSEGVPIYGEFGDFLGFHAMSGRLFSIPDTEIMQRLANASARGLYVRAEDPGATEKILDFVGSKRIGSGDLDQRLGIILALFFVVALIYLRLLL